MRIRSFHLSTQGASHIKKNKECQDASESHCDDTCAVAIVCDGHGGNDYVRSARGSAIACRVAKENILDFVKDVDTEELKYRHDQLLRTLEGSIIADWNEEVKADYDAHPLEEAELAVLSDHAKQKYCEKGRIESAYGTTLIAVVITKTYWFGLHIGDGKCVAVNTRGEFAQPIPWDELCFLNATTSICDSDAIDRFRNFFSEELPAAVIVGTDGVDDCFKSDEQLYHLYKTVLYSFATTDYDEAVNGLRDYIPRLSAKGSGDDVSIAAVLDLDALSKIESITAFDTEKEKARVEENTRLEAQKAEEERQQVQAEHIERIKQQQMKRQQELDGLQESLQRKEEELKQKKQRLQQKIDEFKSQWQELQRREQEQKRKEQSLLQQQQELEKKRQLYSQQPWQQMPQQHGMQEGWSFRGFPQVRGISFRDVGYSLPPSTTPQTRQPDTPPVAPIRISYPNQPELTPQLTLGDSFVSEPSETPSLESAAASKTAPPPPTPAPHPHGTLPSVEPKSASKTAAPLPAQEAEPLADPSLLEQKSMFNCSFLESKVTPLEESDSSQESPTESEPLETPPAEGQWGTSQK